MLQSCGLSNGKKIREPELPTTSDILRTRPFAPRNQDVSTPEDTRSLSEKMTGAEFRYNGVSIPTYAPSTESPTLQREEVLEKESALKLLKIEQTASEWNQMMEWGETIGKEMGFLSEDLHKYSSLLEKLPN